MTLLSHQLVRWHDLEKFTIIIASSLHFSPHHHLINAFFHEMASKFLGFLPPCKSLVPYETTDGFLFFKTLIIYHQCHAFIEYHS